jgi:hypothetical protein
MSTVLKSLRHASVEELSALEEAIYDELDRRLERVDAVADSARRRSVRRKRSYRHDTGSAAPPIRVVGLRSVQRPCVA